MRCDAVRGWGGWVGRTPKMSKMDSDESAELSTVGLVLAEVLQVRLPDCRSKFMPAASYELRARGWRRRRANGV